MLHLRGELHFPLPLFKIESSFIGRDDAPISLQFLRRFNLSRPRIEKDTGTER